MPMIFYDFKVGLSPEECLKCLQLVYVNEFLSHFTLFRWLTEFHKDRNSLLEEENTRRHMSVQVPENILIMLKILMDDNH